MRAERSYMTLGNMRANGVRTLAAWCLGRGCDHFRVLDVSGYPDDVPVPSFGPRLRCERCGHLGADARPNWNEMYKPEPITRATNVRYCADNDRIIAAQRMTRCANNGYREYVL